MQSRFRNQTDSRIRRLLNSHLTPAARRAAWNFGWMVLARAIGQAALFGIILLLGRSLSQEQFGIFMTALAIEGYV